MTGFQEMPPGSTWGLVRQRVEGMLREIYTGTLSLLGPFTVGNGTDYTTIEADGSVRHFGNATVWDDIQGNLVGRALSSTAGKVDYNWAENTVTFNSGGSIEVANDLVIFNLQDTHRSIPNVTMNLHLHWEQVDNVAREITVRYRTQDNGSAKNTVWKTVVIPIGGGSPTDAFTYTSGTLNQLTDLVDETMPDGVSNILQVKMARTDSVAGDIEVTFLDAHVELDAGGSRQEYIK